MTISSWVWSCRDEVTVTQVIELKHQTATAEADRELRAKLVPSQRALTAELEDDPQYAWAGIPKEIIGKFPRALQPGQDPFPI